MLKVTLSVIGLLVLCHQHAAAGEPTECSASGGLTYVCGLANAEDLVSVPDTHWVLSSSMVPGGGVYLVDSVEKTWSQIYTGAARHDKQTYGACNGAPALESFISHGLNIRSGDDGHSTL